jgi:hypothetical protein
MKRKRFIEEQIITIRKQTEDCLRVAKRLKQLED